MGVDIGTLLSSGTGSIVPHFSIFVNYRLNICLSFQHFRLFDWPSPLAGVRVDEVEPLVAQQAQQGASAKGDGQDGVGAEVIKSSHALSPAVPSTAMVKLEHQKALEMAPKWAGTLLKGSLAGRQK